MRVSISLALAATALLPATAMAADSVQLTPGRWEETIATVSVSLDGRPLPADAFKNQRSADCISPEFALEPSKYFLEPDRQKDCKPSGSISGGRIAMAGKCTNMPFGEMMVTSTGTYQPKSYEMVMKADAIVEGKPLVINFVMHGEFVGACRGDEDS
jgi:hypothetical protein